jgi:hypothetical protein
MRSFIRHPTDIPIEIRLADQTSKHEPLRNISHGGLCFLQPQAVPVGSVVLVRISFTVPPFEASCRVSWCQPDGNAWHVGVEFLDQGNLFRVRMVEQICHIEHYRRTASESQGRALSSHEAALEWIERFAETFPYPETESELPEDKKK